MIVKWEFQGLSKPFEFRADVLGGTLRLLETYSWQASDTHRKFYVDTVSEFKRFPQVDSLVISLDADSNNSCAFSVTCNEGALSTSGQKGRTYFSSLGGNQKIICDDILLSITNLCSTKEFFNLYRTSLVAEKNRDACKAFDRAQKALASSRKRIDSTSKDLEELRRLLSPAFNID